MSDIISLQNENEVLKRDLLEKNKNLIFAAECGKKLLDENAELHTQIETTIKDCDYKIEKFKQENYSLHMKLEAKERTVKTLTNEIENLEKLGNEKTQVIHTLKGELAELKKNLSSNEVLIESLRAEITIQAEKFTNLQDLFEENQKEPLVSNLSESGLGESTLELENQIVSLKNDKKGLLKDIVELNTALKAAFLRDKNKQAELDRTLLQLEEKECQLTSMFNQIELAKSENEELQVEIDQMKFAATDPLKKGNSIFAELEDNRKMMEKQVISLNSKFETCKKHCDIKTRQIAKLKLNVASLINMTTSQADLQYQQHLEQSLASTNEQLKKALLRNAELEEKLNLENLQHNSCDPDHSGVESSENNYLQHLYKESREKLSSLEKELNDRCFTIASLNDQTLHLTRKVRAHERELDSAKAEIIRLGVHIEDLRSSRGAEPTKADGEVKIFRENLPPPSEDEGADEGPPKEKLLSLDHKLRLREQTLTAGKPTAQVVPICSAKLPIDSGRQPRGPDLKNGAKIPRDSSKKVAFDVTEDQKNEKSNCSPPKPKPRKKLEAPHIKVNTNNDLEQSNCKVQ